MALFLFLSWDFSSWQLTTRPVGMWVTRTAESVVLTLWPPWPPERKTSTPYLADRPRETECAAERAPHLRGYTKRIPVLFRNKHALDLLAVEEPEEELPRAVGRYLLFHYLHRIPEI